jgi:hypothetical protein
VGGKAAPKVRVAKLPESKTTSIHDKAPELALPPWNVPVPKPSQELRYVLPPPLLFKAASPAVYAVLGKATTLATSQGSAVAVSLTEVITNCHVVARAMTITLANATTRLQAESSVTSATLRHVSAGARCDNQRARKSHIDPAISAA